MFRKRFRSGGEPALPWIHRGAAMPSGGRPRRSRPDHLHPPQEAAMKAFYDSEADALQIHFTEPPRVGYAEDVEGDGTACFVEIDDNEEKGGAGLLNPERYSPFLGGPAK